MISEDPETNAALICIIGELYLVHGRVKEAEKYFMKYKAQVLDMYTEQDAATSDCYSILSAFYSAQKKYGKAVNYAGRALLIRMKIFGAQAACVAESHYNLGLLYRATGRLIEAKREFSIAKEIKQQELLGKSSSNPALQSNLRLELAQIGVSLGFVLQLMGDPTAAAASFQRSHMNLLSELGPNHARTVEAEALLLAVDVSGRRLLVKKPPTTTTALPAPRRNSPARKPAALPAAAAAPIRVPPMTSASPPRAPPPSAQGMADVETALKNAQGPTLSNANMRRSIVPTGMRRSPSKRRG
jgi:hypothetical protein